MGCPQRAQAFVVSWVRDQSVLQNATESAQVFAHSPAHSGLPPTALVSSRGADSIALHSQGTKGKEPPKKNCHQPPSPVAQPASEKSSSIYCGGLGSVCRSFVPRYLLCIRNIAETSHC